MAQRYARVLARSFIGNYLREEGEVIPYNGEFGSNLVEVDKDGNVVKQKGKTKADPFDHDGDGRPGGSLPRAKQDGEALA